MIPPLQALLATAFVVLIALAPQAALAHGGEEHAAPEKEQSQSAAPHCPSGPGQSCCCACFVACSTGGKAAVAAFLPAWRVVRVLERLREAVGLPRIIVVDNGLP